MYLCNILSLKLKFQLISKAKKRKGLITMFASLINL